MKKRTEEQHSPLQDCCACPLLVEKNLSSRSSSNSSTHNQAKKFALNYIPKALLLEDHVVETSSVNPSSNIWILASS